MENTDQISDIQNNENKFESTIAHDNNLKVVSEISVRSDKPNNGTNHLIFNQTNQNNYKKIQIINNLQQDDNGSQKLVDEYNINDKAHSDSSEEDFIKTTSNFKHATEHNEVI